MMDSFMDSFLLSYFIYIQLKVIASTKGQFDTSQKPNGTPFSDIDATNEEVQGLPIVMRTPSTYLNRNIS